MVGKTSATEAAGTTSTADTPPSDGSCQLRIFPQDSTIPRPVHESACSAVKDRTIVAASAVVRRLLTQAERIANSKLPVLIEGENGTGKELIAHLIHSSSPRSRKPFVRVNCAALSESLVESELFGHEKGAFTSAEDSRPGRFELADGGTFLLDEISEMSARLQAKLLRVLEEEEFERVGSSKTLQVDVRIIATTNRDLERECRLGNFRADLYYRLNGLLLTLPPLRARPEDIRPLADYFFEQFKREGGSRLQGISARAMEMLTAYAWPGNVRQLRNVIHRACILADGREIQPQDLPAFADLSAPAIHGSGGTLAEMERHLILNTLRESGGNKTAAAKQLGVTPRTLLNKLNEYRKHPPSVA